MNKKDLLEIIADLPANVILHLHITMGDESEETPEVEKGVQYKVETGDKKNNRVKVRAQPSLQVGEIGFVVDGDVITGTGYEFKGFAEITQPLAGWVELEYLQRI